MRGQGELKGEDKALKRFLFSEDSNNIRIWDKGREDKDCGGKGLHAPTYTQLREVAASEI